MFRRSKGPPAPRRSFVGRPHSLRAQVQQRELPHADPIDPHRGPVATSVLVEQPGEQGRRTEQRQRIDDQYPDERMQVDLRRAEFQTVLASVKDGSARSDLCLKGMFLSILQIQELAGALQACGGKGKDTILYDLNLPDNFIKDEGMAVIAAMLKEVCPMSSSLAVR